MLYITTSLHLAFQVRKSNLKQTSRRLIVRLHFRETTCAHSGCSLIILSKICCFLTTSLICFQHSHLYMTRDFYRRWRTINVSTKQRKLVEPLVICGRFFHSPKFGGKPVARVSHSSHTLFAMFLSKIHSRPPRPSSFCSAPRIATSEMVQFSENARRIRFVFSANQTVRLGSEQAQSDGRSVNRELQVLNRGRNSWC